MPTTYRINFSKRGAETIDSALVVSDTYTGLTAAAIIVNAVLSIGPSKKDLDVDVGQQGIDQIDLVLNPEHAVTVDDVAAVSFILDAQASATDETKKRYVAWLLDVSDPIDASDFEFRGILKPAMSGSGSNWKDGQYGVAPNPDFVWRMTATSLEIEDLLEEKLEDLVAEIAADSTWMDANVRDALGWFYRADGVDDYGHREGRYGSMVDLITVLQRLFDEATSGHPITVTVLDSDLGLSVRAGAFVGLTTERSSGFLGLGSEVVNFRYGDPAVFYPKFDGGTLWDPPNGSTGEWPYKAGSVPGITSVHLSDCEVSWRLLTPRSEVQAISWLAYDTLGELLYRLAFSLGGWVEWEYVDTTNLNVRILTRKELVSATKIYPADTTIDDIDVQPNDPKSGRLIYPASLFAKEGWDSSYYYQADGTWGPPKPWSGRSTPGPDQDGGPAIAVTISPTIAVLYDKSNDAEVEFHDDYHLAPMPHNGVFYKGPSTPEKRGFPGSDLVDLHTALYVRFTAPVGDPCIGCEGKEVVRPIAVILVEDSVGGVPITRPIQRIESYLDRLGRVDHEAYLTERRISVPYLTKFRTDPAGADDWRHCRVGNLIELDGREYLIVGIERDWESSTTKLRLHDTDRAAFAEGSGTVPDAPDESPLAIGGGIAPRVGRAAYIAAGAIPRYAAVIADGYGRLHAASADGFAYGRVLGIALDEAAVGGERVEIATSGFVDLDDEYFSAGDRIFLRTIGSGAPAVANLSADPVRSRDSDEYLHQVVAVAMSTRRIRIEHERPVYLRENVPAVDFSTLGAGGV